MAASTQAISPLSLSGTTSLTAATSLTADTQAVTAHPSTVTANTFRSLTPDMAAETMEEVLDINDGPTLGMLQETLEMATISDMLNESEFVRMPHNQRLKEMQELLGRSSTDSVEVITSNLSQQSQASHSYSVLANSTQIQSDDETSIETVQQQEQEGDSESSAAVTPSDDDVDNEAVLDDITDNDSRVLVGNLQIVEDHFLEDTSNNNTEDDLPETESGQIDQDAASYGDLSMSPPSVGGIPSSTPPPTYAECMKHAIPLSFIDFWPQCISLNDDNFLYSKFETFDRVLEAANLWLQEHANIVIRNCETTEVKAASLDEYILSTAAKVSTFRSSFRPLLYVRGLRVWYSSKIINKLPFSFAVTPCMLAYKNIKPELVNVGDHLEYEGFAALVEKLNVQIEEGEVTGRILNVESVCLKEPDTPEEGRTPLVTDPDESTWRDSYSKTARYILRVYVLPEQQVSEKLFFKDFLPETSNSSRSHPKFRDFTTVMDDCRLWMVHLNSRYRIINAQTIEVKLVAREKLRTNATFFSDYEGTPRVRYVRVYYSEDVCDAEIEYGAPLLSHKTFIPATLKKRRHETLAALMHRVETWLRATGATVICAETLSVLEQRCTDKKDADFSLYRSEWMEANTEYDHETLLYVVRVYLDTVYPEPPPQIFLDGEEDPLDEDCCIL